MATAPCRKTYGIPLYSAACVPVGRIAAAKTEPDPNADQDQEPDLKAQDLEPPNSDRLFVAVCGGGGDGNSGVRNAIVVSAFDFQTRYLSDEPVCRLETEKELPYRMAMHPGGDGFVVSFPDSCRWFEWVYPENNEPMELSLRSSETTLTNLQDVGQQLALTFNADGSVLAAGGEDGHIRVFKWPSLDIILDQPDAHTTVKDLDFSADARYLVSLGSPGPRVWDLNSATTVANITREDGEIFGFCRFCQSTTGNQLLYMTAMQGDYGKIISWNVNSWERLRSKKIVRESISAFNMSNDGNFFAMGTVEGNIVILNSNLQPLTTVKKAHLGIITKLVFSEDSRALVSTSFDYTVRVTLIEGKKKKGLNMRLVVFTILLAILLYFIQLQRNNVISAD